VKKNAIGNVIATVELAKDMPEGATMASQLKVVELGLDQDGDPITSCVVLPCGIADPCASPQGNAQGKLNPNQRRFLDILRTAVLDVPADPKDTVNLPANVQAVARDTLKKYCVSKGFLEESDSANARAKVSNMLNALAGKKIIGTTNKYVWFAR
jgi:hypothetical protein